MPEGLEHTARCSCGDLRIKLRNDPDVVVVCNCTACQRRTGSAFAASSYRTARALSENRGQTTIGGGVPIAPASAECSWIRSSGVPTGIRTPVCAVRGRRPGPLDDGDPERGARSTGSPLRNQGYDA